MSITFCSFCALRKERDFDVLMIKRILTENKKKKHEKKYVKRIEKMKVIKDNTLVNINFCIVRSLADNNIGNMEKADIN